MSDLWGWGDEDDDDGFEQTWYHASPHDLERGTKLTPSGGGSNFDYDDWAEGQGRQDHLWVTNNLDNAEGWARSFAHRSPDGKAHLYEVLPDEEPQRWDGEGGADQGHVTPSAEVYRKIKTINHGHRTASTDGVRYAHIVEADVADDLRRLREAANYQGTAAQDPQAMVQRLRDLNHRHLLHRSSRPVPDRVLAEHPPLSVREDNERKKLTEYAEGLRHRWDNMEPMAPDEEAAHMAFHGPYARRDPATMTDRQKASYYAELQHYGPQTKRDHHHLNQMQDWAQGHFGNMVNDAQDEVARHRQYLTTGTHPTGVTTLEGLEDAHKPELTGAWASELSANGTSNRLRARQGEYHDALYRVANYGPLHVDDGQPLENVYAFDHLENARNNLRVEMQHAYLFNVPHTDELSPIADPAERHARSGLANPRFAHGTGGRTDAARQAYQVNCQRCVLAAEARHRGHNVEARPNYRDETNSSGNDRQFKDHDIASWFRNPDGTVPKWIDAQDAQHPSAKDRMGDPLRMKTFPGEQQWDHMHEQIKSWGPGARAAVVMSHPTLDGGHSRHIIHAVVDDKGKVNYIDPQTGNNDASHHRESIGYNLHADNQTKRLWLDKRPLDEEDRTMLHNKNASPLRYMRLDDKQLSPETAQHLVDRGTAGGRAIIPPQTN